MNKLRYLKILENISKESRDPVEKLLVVDGTNTFIRSAIANPLLSENGVHMGAIQGFLISIGYAVKLLKITEVVIVFDGRDGSRNRKKIYEEYKGNRTYNKRRTTHAHFGSLEEEQNALKWEMMRLLEYLKCLPIKIVIADYMEADDIIAYIASKYQTKLNCIIMSTDKDFFQLVNDKITVWSPTKKILYDKELIFKEYGIVNNENFILVKTIMGDDSDNISGIDGVKLKTLQKILPDLFTSTIKFSLDEFIILIEGLNGKLKSIINLKAGIDVIKRNYMLMDLTCKNFINEKMEMILENSLNRTPYILNKHQFLMLLLEDQISTLFKNPEEWIKNTWSKVH